MTSHLSSKQNFIYPKFLKPLGATAITNVNPLSLVPDGIPGYIAPKSQNFTDSQFFFNNRSITITEPSYTPKVQSKNKTPIFFSAPSPRQQELNSETHNIPDKDREIDNFSAQDHKIQNNPQHSNINLKSNIQSNSSSNLAEVELPKNETIPSSRENPIIQQEIVNSDYLAEVHLHNSEPITPSINNPIIEQETINPQLDSLANVELPKNETIPSSRENPIIHQEIVNSDPVSNVHLPNNDTITHSVENPIIAQETAPPKLDTVADVSYVHQVPNKNHSNSTPENTFHSKLTAPFSFMDLSRKVVDVPSNNNLSIIEKEEHNIMELPIPFSDIISSKSQRENTINRETKLSVPDSWSSISELINESSSKNNLLNAKSENNKNREQVIPSSNNIFSNKKRNNLSLSNAPKINQAHDHINILNKKKDTLVSNDSNTYKVQLTTDKSNYSGYQYQPLNSNITFPEKISSDKPSIQEVNNSTLSLKEEIPTEDETLDNDTEATNNESELLDILAGEIYNLLQQRLEIERERQGKYYR